MAKTNQDSVELDLTPESAFDRAIEEGVRRMERGWGSLLATGLVGGIDVATGVLGLLVVETLTGSKVLGGLAFSIGFIALLLARSELFTENFLVPVSAAVAHEASWWQLARLWVLTLVTNLIGGWAITGLIVTGVTSVRHEALKSGTYYIHIGLGWRAFALGLLGGLVITLMTWMEHSSTSIGAHIVGAIIAAFLLAAAQLNHAIVASLLVFAALQTGHAPFGYVDWLQALGWAVLANTIGGVGLVTLLRLLQVPHAVAAKRGH